MQARGDLDQAVKIRREDELPVYERLGDVRERAVNMGKIADILQARGDLDQALKIHREDELPVFERLGDVHSRAATLYKIVDVLLETNGIQRGRIQEIADNRRRTPFHADRAAQLGRLECGRLALGAARAIG